MIGTVSRVDADGVYVEHLPDLPGIELGPLLAVRHRVSTGPDVFTTYAAGDIVRVVEESPNEYVVAGILA